MKKMICTMLLICILTGCNTSTRNASQEPHQMHPRSYGGNITTQHDDRMNASRIDQFNENTGEVHDIANGTDHGKMSNDKRVSHLKALAKQVEGVQNANCIILGNTAIVGIDVDGDLERARVGTIKYSVAEALRKDPEGVDSIVTADADVSERIKEIGEHIRQGHPISGFASELADMVGRIIPQLPKDVKVRQNPNEPAQDQYMQQHTSEKRQQKAQ